MKASNRRLRASLLVAGAAAVAAVVATVAAATAPPPAAAQDKPAPRPKVVVLGFDGLAADRVETLMAAGKLPNLARMKERGGYSRLRPSNPAQSPVSWASIISGWNPGKTGITDFLRRRDMDPSRITFANAERVPMVPLSGAMRVLLVCAAGALGAIAGGALIFAKRRVWPAQRKTKAFESAITLGAAVFACAAFVVQRWVPQEVQTAVNLRSGEPFWVTLDKAGVRCVALEGPMCFPPDPMETGCCLSGLGVPDMAGTWGSFSLWSNDPSLPAKTETAGQGFFVNPKDGKFDVVVAGPPHPLLTRAAKDAIEEDALREARRRESSFEWTRARRRASETLELLTRTRLNLVAKLGVTIHGGANAGATVVLQDGATVDLVPGKWSDLLPVEFAANPVVRPRGRVRLYLEDAGSDETPDGAPSRPFKLFAGQVQWDLADVPPNVSLTSPRSFAGELAAENGPIETIGWPEMTNPHKDRMLTDQAFLDHTYLLMALRERRLHARLKRGDFDCLFALFAEPDRVQHSLYRHVDAESPLHDAEAAKRFGGEIDRIYVEADRIVGDTVAAAGEGTTVLVVSDHGFAPFRRGVNLNNFLCSKGYQVRAGAGDGEAINVAQVGSSVYFTGVEWPQTKAYAMGLGNIYVNLAGREPRGSVPIDQYDAVVDAIVKDLEALTDDGMGGAKVVRRAYRGKDIYHGARATEAPDIVVGFEWGYRISWDCALGAMADAVIQPNTQPWSGDHCSVDPDLVPAVLFSSMPLSAASAGGATPSVEDVAPSVLSLYGVAPNDPDGNSFLR